MKLTIIAPHFPPSALPPSQRIRLMMNYFEEYKVDAKIITVDHSKREEIADDWMVELIGEGHDIDICTAFDAKTSRKFGIGDLGLRMLPFLFFKLIRQVNKENTDFILYPVPPWYILMIAPIIKKISGVPYAIDFIDPWVEGGDLPKDATLKRKISQWIARKMEAWVTKNAAIIYSVSEGINEQLKIRHTQLLSKEMYAIPYGADQNDFKAIKWNNNFNREFVLIRYIGAVWDDAYMVIDAIFAALSQTNFDFKAEFYGTSYAGGHLAKAQLVPFLNKYQLSHKVAEYPNRVEYKKAVELNLESDVLLLFGGMQAYYAASKLFGLIVSQKPFVAFLHKDSFPAQFLSDFKYPYLVEYSNEVNELPSDKIEELKNVFNKIHSEFSNFEPLNIEDSRIQKHTARGMTEAFVQPMKKYYNERL